MLGKRKFSASCSSYRASCSLVRVLRNGIYRAHSSSRSSLLRVKADLRLLSICWVNLKLYGIKVNLLNWSIKNGGKLSNNHLFSLSGLLNSLQVWKMRLKMRHAVVSISAVCYWFHFDNEKWKFIRNTDRCSKMHLRFFGFEFPLRHFLSSGLLPRISIVLSLKTWWYLAHVLTWLTLLSCRGFCSCEL